MNRAPPEPAPHGVLVVGDVLWDVGHGTEPVTVVSGVGRGKRKRVTQHGGVQGRAARDILR